ncbi:muconate cycloisomerase [Fictibacillus enclensis]|uniref:Muconate cycloisomerase n=1 Tax=Fictibacillus enclensis TaxID=1017270 RepID=A0A0V8J8S9_9BACL|nr:muconate cycloisomerase family protein [Fictibacillus enclensis]KSU83542.1 muconate cycloisomerase [Fictibacillus enclensis]SCC17140.1 muconate cycloisomerase [Fictibacillus enclensis]
MKIHSLHVYILDLPTIRPHHLSMHTIVTQTIVMACVKSTDGLEGWGEVATIGGVSYGEESPESIKLTAEKYITPLILGKDPTNFDALSHYISTNVKGNYFAKALVESSVVDLVAKSKNIPAYELFGGKCHDSLSVAWTLASGDTGKDIEEAQNCLQLKKHNIFKLKIGKGDPKENVAHVTKIKAAVGDQASVRVDVNQAWDEATSLYCIEALEAGGVDLIEQPLAAWNNEGMTRLVSRFKVPVMADESLGTVQDAYQIAKHRAADVFALKPAKAGGLTATKKIAAIAEASGIPLYGGTMIESTLGTAICAQLYSTIPEMSFGTELFGPLLFKDNVTLNDLDYEKFQLKIPEGPGFGLEVDKEKLKHYAREFVGSTI